MSSNQLAFVWFMSGLVSGAGLFQIGMTAINLLTRSRDRRDPLEQRVKDIEDYLQPLKDYGKR